MNKTQRLIIMLLAVMAASITAQAQWRYGIRLGGAFSRPTGSNEFCELKGGNGFSGGLAFEWQMPTGGLAIGASALYERRNTSAGMLSDDGPGVFKRDYFQIGRNYIAVPIDIKYKFGIPAIGGLAGPYVFTGPDLAWRLGGGIGPRTHMGWNVGAGFDIINFVQVSAGYRFGITNLGKDYDEKWRDSGAFVAVTILFDF